jgi:hypothetical protein
VPVTLLDKLQQEHQPKTHTVEIQARQTCSASKHHMCLTSEESVKQVRSLTGLVQAATEQ